MSDWFNVRCGGQPDPKHDEEHRVTDVGAQGGAQELISEERKRDDNEKTSQGVP